MTNDVSLAEARHVLADPAASFLQVQKAVSLLEKFDDSLTYRRIGLSSNVQIDRLAVYLRRHALLAGVRLLVTVGGYDTLMSDVSAFQGAGLDYMLALPFFDNLSPALEGRLAAGLKETIVDLIEQRLIDQYQVSLASGRTLPQILVGGLYRAWPVVQVVGKDRVVTTIERFQTSLAKVVDGFANATMLDMEALAANVGLRAAMDRRFYAQAKAPFALPMLDEIARGAVAATRGFGQYFYKILALDCDNTLWGGVIGEDLLDGIKLSQFEFPGNVFWRAQQEILGLERAGTVLCLCTKNNPADVEEVFASHPDMVLQPKDLTISKINWDDKASNLRAIASELNVGLDSIIFLDDSSYELEGVRSQVPGITIFQVPNNPSDYPLVIEKIKSLFLAGGVSAESLEKSQQYKQKLSAESTRGQFTTQEAYLASLNLRALISFNSKSDQLRISELTQKSNQFNLTTRRYTQGEIRNIAEGPKRHVYSVVVEDRLGSAGLTAVAILDFMDEVAEVEAFLMSCRVIGRGIEEAIWSAIAGDAAEHGCSRIRGRFIRSAKNALVERFYDRLGFEIEIEDELGRTYVTSIEALKDQKSPWVEVVRVG